MHVYEAVNQKRAIRQFSDQPLPDDILVRILNAGRRSGSSKNNQPWHFVVLRDRGRLVALKPVWSIRRPSCERHGRRGAGDWRLA